MTQVLTLLLGLILSLVEVACIFEPFTISSLQSDTCWSFNGSTTDLQPSNWLTQVNDILFHLTFRKAEENVLIMNDQRNGVWGTEIEEYFPFNGEITVFVTRTINSFTVKITDTTASNTQNYIFQDRIPQSPIVSVTGAASGNEVDDCNPPTLPPTPNPYPCAPAQSFFEDFSGTRLDGSKWLVAHKTWGGGNNGYTNGGVVLENVKVDGGSVVFNAHGSLYTGPVMGINPDGSRKDDGERTGGAIATKDYFGPGKYEVRMKVAPEFGVCSAIWTFFYKDGSPIINHEIDIEIPGRPAGPFEDIDFDYALLNTWLGEIPSLYTSGYTPLPSRMDDDNFHVWRFDWHTDADNRKVDFYVDDIYLRTITTHVPIYAGRIWLGAWFPGFWAGDANFDQSRMEVDWVRFSPFDEVYQCPEESYPDFGWAPVTDPPSPTPSLSPISTTTCPKRNEIPFQVRIQNDATSDKLIYAVQKRKRNGKFRKKVMNGNMMVNTLEIDTACLNVRHCYRFKIVDKQQNDGICCEHGDGWYDLHLDDSLLKYSQFKSGRSEKEIFGTCE